MACAFGGVATAGFALTLLRRGRRGGGDRVDLAAENVALLRGELRARVDRFPIGGGTGLLRRGDERVTMGWPDEAEVNNQSAENGEDEHHHGDAAQARFLRALRQLGGVHLRERGRIALQRHTEIERPGAACRHRVHVHLNRTERGGVVERGGDSAHRNAGLIQRDDD